MTSAHQIRDLIAQTTTGTTRRPAPRVRCAATRAVVAGRERPGR